MRSLSLISKGPLFERLLKRQSLQHHGTLWYPGTDIAITTLCHTWIILRKISKKWARALNLLLILKYILNGYRPD